MIRFARLFLWLRWKLLRGYLQEISSRGTLSSISAAISALLLILAGIVLIVIAGALAMAAVRIAADLSQGGSDAIAAAAVLRFTFAAMFAVLLVLPAVRAGRGSFGKGSAGIGRLLLLPISRARLHAIEVLGSLSDPLLLAGLPALIVLAISLALKVHPIGALVVLLAAIVMALTLMAWSAFIGIAMQLLFRDRRRAEWALLLTFTITIGLSVAPALVSIDRVEEKASNSTVIDLEADESQRAKEAAESDHSAVTAPADQPQSRGTADTFAARILKLADTFPIYLQWIPSESFARALKLAADGRVLSALPSLLALAAFGAACWLFSLRLWDRLLRSPEGGQQRTTSNDKRLQSWHLPLISGSISSVAYATARGFMRTVRGKLALITVPMMALVFGSIFRSGQAIANIEGLIGRLLGESGFLISFTVLMSLLNALPLLANAFATDGAGFTLQALSPISARQLVWGKVVGSFAVFGACLAPSLALAGLLTKTGPVTLLEAFTRGCGAFALAAAAGMWSSLLFPKAVELSSLNNKGNPHPLAQVITMLTVGVAMLVASFGGLIGSLFVGGGLGRFLGTLLAAMLLCLGAWPIIEASARGLRERWESVVVAASS